MKTGHLTAHSISIVNDAGEERILLNGGSGDSGCSIVVVSKEGKTLQIQEQPNGFISMAVDGPACRGIVTITPTGLSVKDDEGQTVVTVGNQGPHGPGVTVYKEGHVVFQTPP